ncbi:MAG: 2-isopropylmalate synthase [Cardiobacteriaceae bacterium]|nr:2-isopropylmalate synthase [Cardiobacteriaceae bacterium]
MRTIKIFDTTMRDGEQTPRVSMNKEDKIAIAKHLEAMGVDVIEAGFAIASEGDFEAVKAVAEAVEKPIVCSLARAVKGDIERAAEALKNAKHPRIHTFIATSDIHLEHKLKISREECLQRAVEMVAYAKTFVDDVEFSCEDATRSDWDFLVEVYSAVIEAGATVINVPDTVGFTLPQEYFDLISYLKKNVRGVEKVDISLHGHNDLGMATANALSGVLAGATQIEVAMNGLGERAGNTSLEEVVMALDTRQDFYQAKTNIVTEKIYETAKLVSAISGIEITPVKAITGANCFLHESGIHQDGFLKARQTYEIMDPARIGIPPNDGLVLGKHSGRSAFRHFVHTHGYDLDDARLDAVFAEFKKLTDRKKYITIEDISGLIAKQDVPFDDYHLISYSAQNDSAGKVSVTVTMSREGRERTATASGNGQVDAAFNAINQMVGAALDIEDYQINAVSSHSNALGEARIRMRHGDEVINTSGLDKDIIFASMMAYVQGINRFGL